MSGPGSSVAGRAPFRAIVDRPKLALPGGARVAVWIIVNVEHWQPDGPMPRTIVPAPMGQPLLPDVPNWAWHEYGMRVGFWRFLDVLGERGVRATFAVNGSCCTAYPRVCEAAFAAGWEFIGHGFVQRPMHRVEDEAAAIRDTVAAIADLTGRPPRGWESPGLTETDRTADLLAAAGIEYVADWCWDDLPVEMATTSGRLASIPYSVEVNDVVVHAVQQQPSAAMYERGRDGFDRLHREGATIPRVMAISIHPYLMGVPHRIGYLERLLDHILGHDGVLMWTGSEILDWYRAESAAVSAR